MPKLNERQKELASQVSFSYWCMNSSLMLDGYPFSFKNHEYLIDIYQDTRPKKVFKKGAQLGFSTLGILDSVWSCKHIYPKGLLYLFPTKDDVSDFSHSRFKRLVSENPKTIGGWVGDTDQTNIKKIGTAYLFLRGSRSRTALKSIPVDKVIFDEFDEMKTGKAITSSDKAAKFDPIALARERYSHSEFQHETILSTPTFPDFGIEAEFAVSDQKYWYIRCEHCNHSTCLELAFPDCLVPQGDRVIRACRKCGREIHPKNGQWVAKYPERDVSGYYVSQLNSIYIDPATIFNTHMALDSLKPTERTEFWNSKMGQGYVETENRLSKQQVLALCGSESPASSLSGDLGPCTMGVDQGSDLHVVIGKRVDNAHSKIIYLGEHKDWDELDGLMKRFNVYKCVVDGLPEQRNARAFAKRHHGRIFLNYYDKRRKGAIKWDWNQLKVNEDRTESMDDSHELIQQEMIILPKRTDMVEKFALHCHNVAKKLEVDEESGSQEYHYIKLGDDHFRHAFNYFCLASIDAPKAKKKVRPETFRLQNFEAMKGSKKRVVDNYYN